ncbi:uncharacterized protein [Arachis hypogaea]
MTRREHREHQELKEIEILSPSFFPQLVTLVSHCHRRPKLLDAVASSSFLFCKTQKAQHIVFIFVGFSVRRRHLLSIVILMLDGFLKIPIAIHPQLHQLVCTEDRFFHRKQNGVKSYCSLVLRQYLILLKQLEEEFQSVFHRMWIIVQNPPPLPNESNAKPHIDLLLKTSEDDLKIWPHSFEFRLRVSLAAEG